MTTETEQPPQPAPAGIWEHLCEHPGCERWGAWGYNSGRVTTWRCDEHKGELPMPRYR